MNQGLTRRTLIKTMGIGAGIVLSNGFLPLAWADEPKPQRGEHCVLRSQVPAVILPMCCDPPTVISTMYVHA